MSALVNMSTADALRAALTARLMDEGWIRSAPVEAAFAKVPRHVFVPDGIALEDAYADTAVVTKRDAAGMATSSVSAPWLQAHMIEQARLRPAASVLEIGSGGYNAALLAEAVGGDGHVTSVDIDADVVGRARDGLRRAGYARVQVAEADGEYGYAANAPYDAIIVTVEAADIPPAWITQLAPDGVIVAPLRVRGNTRSVALVRDGDHLTAVSAELCGFVPMQGAGSAPRVRLPLRGDDIVLRLDDDGETPAGLGGVLAAALERPRVDAWCAVTVSSRESYESLHLWLAGQPRAFGLLAADRDRAAFLGDPQNWVVCPAFLTGASFAYLATREVGEDTWQFGAQGFGPDADGLAADMIGLVEVWDRVHRRGAGPRITVHPHGTVVPGAGAGSRMLVRRRNSTIAVTWPEHGSTAQPDRQPARWTR